ncbi:MAG: hypothetical protein HKN12_09975, partial [Gemmatimonadetes bacterium]|nr:hypothetical protein [Gemmatimonadota bacterium]
SEGCSASLTYARPGNVRVRARTAAFFTVFDLVAAEESAWLDVPREELTVVGDRADPVWSDLPVSPDPMLIALLADPWGGGAVGSVQFSAGTEEVTGQGDGWTVWLDRVTGTPLRYEAGDLRITWAEWADRWDIPWPHDIEVETPSGHLRVRLGRFTLDRSLRPDVFGFDPEEGRTIFTPSEAKSWWAERSGG